MFRIMLNDFKYISTFHDGLSYYMKNKAAIPDQSMHIDTFLADIFSKLYRAEIIGYLSTITAVTTDSNRIKVLLTDL